MEKVLRKEAISKAVDDYKSRNGNDTLRVEFRGATKSFEVIRVSTDLPLLNHDNSRLRAQLATHPDKDVVLNDPTSARAQEILSELLRKTEKFKELQTQLKDLGQKNAGVITRDGMLVNGNTRLVALRDLGVSGIDVAVLPEDANSGDFFAVEMSLQMTPLLEQQYTFTNRLLLVESLQKRLPNDEAIFSALNWQRNGPKRLREHERWLGLVETIRQASDFSLPYEYFDDGQEFIKNLDTDYQATLAEDPAAAESLKWSRIFGLLLGLNKDELREIDEDFVDEIASKSFDDQEDLFFSDCKNDDEANSLAEILGESSSTSSTKFNMELASRKIVTLADGNDVKSNLYHLFRAGSRELREQRLREEKLTSPLWYLKDVTEKVDQLAKNLPGYLSDNSFNRGKFAYEAKKLQKSLKELEGAISRQLDLDD